MVVPSAPLHPGNIHDVLSDVSQCLLGLLSKLKAFEQLPALEAAAAQARTIAANMLVLFRHEMFEHHAQEELQLFPAVLGRAEAGDELNRARAMVKQLIADHRRIEALWAQLEPAVKAIAKGRLTNVALEDVESLVQAYHAHAVFEEQEFLPLAESVLGRQRENGWMQALHPPHDQGVGND